MSRVLLTSHRALPLTEDRTAHCWCDQPRARQRHTRSEVHRAHVTFKRADPALVEVVDIVEHNGDGAHAATATARARWGSSTQLQTSRVARGCLISSAHAPHKEQQQCRSQRARWTARQCSGSSQPGDGGRAQSLGRHATSDENVRLRESSRSAFQRYPGRPLTPTR